MSMQSSESFWNTFSLSRCFTGYSIWSTIVRQFFQTCHSTNSLVLTRQNTCLVQQLDTHVTSYWLSCLLDVDKTFPISLMVNSPSIKLVLILHWTPKFSPQASRLRNFCCWFVMVRVDTVYSHNFLCHCACHLVDVTNHLTIILPQNKTGQSFVSTWLHG